MIGGFSQKLRIRSLQSGLVFYGRRKRNDQRTRAHEAGEALWREDLDVNARRKLAYAVENFFSGTGEGFGMTDPWGLVQRAVLEDLGLSDLGGWAGRPELDVVDALKQAHEDVVFSILEAVLRFGAIASVESMGGVSREDRWAYERRLPTLRSTIETVLREHWVKVDLVGDQFVGFDSRVLHEDVVRPALSLLGDTTGMEAAETAFLGALREIHEGSPEDAITDATTALQEALGGLGARGNTVSKCIDAAVRMGLLTDYDRKLGEWLEADRSNKGDAHNAAPASPSDAWLVVHVVGSLLVRLLDHRTRGNPQP